MASRSWGWPLVYSQQESLDLDSNKILDFAKNPNEQEMDSPLDPPIGGDPLIWFNFWAETSQYINLPLPFL